MNQATPFQIILHCIRPLGIFKFQCNKNKYFPDRFLINSYHLNLEKALFPFTAKRKKLFYHPILRSLARDHIMPRRHTSLPKNRSILGSFVKLLHGDLLRTAQMLPSYNLSSSLLFCLEELKRLNNKQNKSEQYYARWCAAKSYHGLGIDQGSTVVCLSLIIELNSLRVILVKQFGL